METLLKQREKDLDDVLMDRANLDKVKKEQDKAINALKQEKDQLNRVLLWVISSGSLLCIGHQRTGTRE